MASLLALIFGFAAKVAAQYGCIENYYKINGRVMDKESLQPLPNVKITLSSNNDYHSQSQSDSSGNFSSHVSLNNQESYYKISANTHNINNSSSAYLPKDTLIVLNRSMFVVEENSSRWHIISSKPEILNIYLEKERKRNADSGSILLHPADSLNIKDNISDEFTIQNQLTDSSSLLFEVYPVPTNSEVTIYIRSEKRSDGKLMIFDQTHSLVYQNQIELHPEDNYFRIDMIPFPPGVYVFVILSDKKSGSRKVIRL